MQSLRTRRTPSSKAVPSGNPSSSSRPQISEPQARSRPRPSADSADVPSRGGGGGGGSSNAYSDGRSRNRNPGASSGGGGGGGGGSGAESRTRDARKSRVDDKIKKRMSMRYADNFDYSNLGGAVPAVPSLPGAGSGGSRGAPVGEVTNDPRAVDVQILQRDNFDPDAYLKLKLTNSTEAELKALQSSLLASKSATATDLQRNIFKNYEEFITISKEISTLENDMLELKESISEWKSMPSLLKIEDSSSSATDRRRAQRSSVADLRALYASQLQELHSKIEGSSKFVPAIPGRHIISQVTDVYALNPATYKVEYGVHLVLLDDSFLVAKRRRRRNGESGRLVAEKCWSISEVVLVDVKDTADRTNIIRLRHGREGHVYRTEKSSDKKTLLASFRKASEDFIAKKRKEREGEHERRMSVWTGGSGGLNIPDASSVPALPAWAVEAKGLGAGTGAAKEKSEEDARWIGEFCDELTVAIALREWDQAVELTLKGQERQKITPQLTDKLTGLTESLTSALIHSLSDPSHRKTGVIHITSLLNKLDSAPAAKSAFLKTRGELIKKRIRAIPFEGDIALYIFDLAIVIFTAVKHTAEWYLMSFKDNNSASRLVQWCREQIEYYGVLFGKQVSGSAPSVIADCNDITRQQSKKLLTDNGLDFSYLLNEILSRPTEGFNSISSQFARSTISNLDTPRISNSGDVSDSMSSSTSRRPPPRSRNRPPSNLQQTPTSGYM